MTPEEFVKAMTALWSKPRETADPTLAMRQYTDALSKFSPAQLTAGWTALRDMHERASWPLISEVRKAIMGASSVEGGRSPIAPKWQTYEPFANSTMRTDLARRAKSEGWLLGLWDHCYAKGVIPTPFEIGRLRTAADAANAAAHNLDRKNGLHQVLYRIWELMRDRERKLSAMVPSVAA